MLTLRSTGMSLRAIAEETGRNPTSSQARSKAVDIDRIVSGSSPCPLKKGLIGMPRPCLGVQNNSRVMYQALKNREQLTI
jgi:hypothetical protein